MKLKALIHPEKVGGYSVSIPSLPGCFSEGETIDEALQNIREAAELWLDTALNDLDVEVADDIEDEESKKALQEALAIKIPQEKLLRLCKTHRPPPSWYDEEMKPSA